MSRRVEQAVGDLLEIFVENSGIKLPQQLRELYATNCFTNSIAVVKEEIYELQNKIVVS